MFHQNKLQDGVAVFSFSFAASVKLLFHEVFVFFLVFGEIIPFQEMYDFSVKISISDLLKVKMTLKKHFTCPKSVNDLINLL